LSHDEVARGVNRRRLLALLGGASAHPLAGCLDDVEVPGTPTTEPPPETTPPATGTRTPTGATPTPTPTPTDASNEPDGPVELRFGRPYEPDGGGLVRPSNPRVRRSALLARGGHAELSTPEGQYLVVGLTVEPPSDGWFEPPPRRSLAVAGTGTGGGAFLVRDGPGTLVTPAYEAYEARLALPAPVREYDDPALAWPRDGGSVRWRLPDAVAGRLAAAPAFEVTSVEATRGGSEVTLRLSVRNDGERDGEFLARVRLGGGSSDVWSTLRATVPADRSRTLEATPRSVTDAPVGARLDLSYSGGNATVTVAE
jgi:hypothetical protein